MNFLVQVGEHSIILCPMLGTRSLVRVLVGGKLPSTALDSILCRRFTVCTGYSLIIPGKILLRYVGQKLLEILNTIFSTCTCSLLVAREIQPVSLYKFRSG